MPPPTRLVRLSEDARKEAGLFYLLPAGTKLQEGPDGVLRVVNASDGRPLTPAEVEAGARTACQQGGGWRGGGGLGGFV